MARADCSLCAGTGWKPIEVPERDTVRRVAVRCDCSQDDRLVRALQRARIPRRYEHCDFENFETDVHDDHAQAPAWNKSLGQARLIVQAFARDFGPGSEHGLLLMGPCGVGKTHLAVAALKELVFRGYGGLYYDYRELLKEIQASYNPVSQTSELEVLEPVLKAEVLLLDDLGASKPSAWALETLGHILNSRYNEKRVTLVTTNYLDRETRERAPLVLPTGTELPRAEDTLTDRIGLRIRSRLYEMCRTVEILAPDYRKEIRRARGADKF
jgi:DNA replication protein DnaC